MSFLVTIIYLDHKRRDDLASYEKVKKNRLLSAPGKLAAPEVLAAYKGFCYLQDRRPDLMRDQKYNLLEAAGHSRTAIEKALAAYNIREILYQPKHRKKRGKKDERPISEEERRNDGLQQQS